jgi:hypothetical protein
MKIRFLMMFCLIKISFLFAYDSVDNSELFYGYKIRPAVIEDKDAMVQIQHKVTVFYNYYLRTENDELRLNERILNSLESPLLSEFSFVLEDEDKNGVSKIVAFLIMGRASSSCCRHLLYGHAWSYDPDYRDENLIGKLYMHVLDQVEKFHPEILRVEDSATHPEMIAMFEGAGFHREGMHEKVFKLTDGTYAPQNFYVWFNPNFDPDNKN